MKLKAHRFGVAAALSAFALGGTPAAAERLYTYWKLEPITPEGQQVVTYGEPFGHQRLLPGRLVELEEPVTVKKNQTLAKGTPLYLVFSGDHKQKLFCTVKDLTKTSAGELIIGPLVNKRPCFMDSDNDGRLDKVFSIIDIVYAPPSSRGDLGSAKPIDPVGFRDVDPHAYPVNMTLSFKLSGSKVENTQVTPVLENAGLSNHTSARGEMTSEGYLLGTLGTIVRVHSVEGDEVSIEWATLPDAYIVHGWMSTEVRELPSSMFSGGAAEREEPPAPSEAGGSPEIQP